ncbi:hypothetical protein VDG1235_910 [Verrucomicrobiia bacterium DG1235]|nr:hypothetical protein VDG1235_910 [Verrucomicrobiae bacterium DG1235]
MKLIHLLTAAATLLASAAFADVIVTKDGSSINGKIVGIDDGKITVATDFAGEITIDQAQVSSLSTDEPIYLTLENGTTILGPVSGSEAGLNVASDNGSLSTELSKVTESWQPGTQSPSEARDAATVKSLQRHWAYEAAFDLTGKSGNKSSTGMGTSFRATLAGKEDTLAFFARANFQDADGVKSADDARGGVDYSNNFGDNFNWYVRSEFGYDAIKDIDQLFTVSAGFGKLLSDTETRRLNIRAGVGYLSENYGDIFREDTSAASLDIGLSHRETLTWGTWVNRATFTPTIEDFGNFRFLYDTSLELPLKSEGWSIRTGVNFDYNSEVVGTEKELDTTYYVRMVLKWL